MRFDRLQSRRYDCDEHDQHGQFDHHDDARGEHESAGSVGRRKAACGPLKEISDLDKARNDVLMGADWSAVKPKLIDVLNQGVDAYDRAIPRAPNDLAGELTKLRQFTESSIDFVRASSSLDDFGSKVTADPAARRLERRRSRSTHSPSPPAGSRPATTKPDQSRRPPSVPPARCERRRGREGDRHASREVPGGREEQTHDAAGRADECSDRQSSGTMRSNHCERRGRER